MVMPPKERQGRQLLVGTAKSCSGGLMKATTFKNSKIEVPGWPPDLHVTHSQGYAYAAQGHYAFLCGGSYPCIGWSVVQQNVDVTLEEWCQKSFGATDFQSTDYEVGTAVHSVWRPGLPQPKDHSIALVFTDAELSIASQALRLLVARLDEILLFIEPDAKHLAAYGHKSRDLLIAACTEVENYFQHYMRLASAKPLRGQYFTVRDYVRLKSRLFLDEFEIDMYAHQVIGRFAPFKNWNTSNAMLPWYDAYNKTKHHRDGAFSKASLINCVHAVGACLVLFSIRFGPVWWQSNFINSPIPDAYRLFRQPIYSGDPRKVYVPKIEFPLGVSGKSWGDHTHTMSGWTTIPFSV
jgi:hypothetical protein